MHCSGDKATESCTGLTWTPRNQRNAHCVGDKAMEAGSGLSWTPRNELDGISTQLDYRAPKRQRTTASPLLGYPAPRAKRRRPLISGFSANAGIPTASLLPTISETPPSKCVRIESQSSQASSSKEQGITSSIAGDATFKNTVALITNISDGPSLDCGTQANLVPCSQAAASTASRSQQVEKFSISGRDGDSTFTGPAAKEGMPLSSPSEILYASPGALRFAKATKALSAELMASDVNKAGLNSVQYATSVPPPETSAKRRETGSDLGGGKGPSEAAQGTQPPPEGRPDRRDGREAVAPQDATTRVDLTEEAPARQGRQRFRTESALVRGAVQQVLVINDDCDDAASARSRTSSVSRTSKARGRRVVPCLKEKDVKREEVSEKTTEDLVTRAPSDGPALAVQKLPASTNEDTLQDCHPSRSASCAVTSQHDDRNISFETLCRDIPGLSEYNKAFAKQKAWLDSRFKELLREKDELQAQRRGLDSRGRDLQHQGQEELELQDLLSRSTGQARPDPESVRQTAHPDHSSSSRGRARIHGCDDGLTSMGSSTLLEYPGEEPRRQEAEAPSMERSRAARIADLDAALSGQQSQGEERQLKRRRDPSDDLDYISLDLSTARKATESHSAPRQTPSNVAARPSRKATWGQRKSYPDQIRHSASVADTGRSRDPDQVRGQQGNAQTRPRNEQDGRLERNKTESRAIFERLLGISDDLKSLLRDEQPASEETRSSDASAAGQSGG